MNKKIKIFQMTDREWWAGKSLEDCKQAYIDNELKEYKDEAIETVSDAGEITEKEYNELLFMHEDYNHDLGPEFEENNGKYSTFREELKKRVKQGNKFPELFAVTDDCC